MSRPAPFAPIRFTSDGRTLNCAVAARAAQGALV